MIFGFVLTSTVYFQNIYKLKDVKRYKKCYKICVMIIAIIFNLFSECVGAYISTLNSYFKKLLKKVK